MVAYILGMLKAAVLMGFVCFSWVFLRPKSMYMCNEHGQSV